MGPYFCRGCCRFVRGPLAQCESCGFRHDRDTKALEEPIGWHRKKRKGGGVKMHRV